ncbi:hypothetical protein DVH29_15165 [Pelagibacterium lacus]|uniref:Uncharacterized protein n=1 Tax=Pelagibacterium lacus TaxID=2282655 RepID=A0A369W393_9HYPH|nr:hypothetical protein DVH29_15165 [Pelagibacterium lacus]
MAISRTSLALDAAGPHRRLPRSGYMQRPPAFHQAFDGHLLLYDVFRHADGERVLGIGPPPRNLLALLKASRTVARPSGTPLALKLYASLSTSIFEWTGAPAGTEALELQVADQRFMLPVQPNHSDALSGARLLSTINKNNDLAWIGYWARWHVQLHRTDTIVLFDNGSDAYPIAAIEETLAGVDGLKAFAVIDFPHAFGPVDPLVRTDPFWARFAQIASMSIVLRRFAATARGFLNCDIDELANPPGDTPIYDSLDRTRAGLLILPGIWVEPDAAPLASIFDHSAFAWTGTEKERRRTPAKWVLDPRRPWVGNLGVHPYWHSIRGRPMLGKSFLPDAFFWHFKAINTGWKDAGRASAPIRNAGDICEDTLLRARHAQLRAPAYARVACAI